MSSSFFFQAEDGIRDVADWSSDVCSSDLPRSDDRPVQVRKLLGGCFQAVSTVACIGLGIFVLAVADLARQRQIGRASWRERAQIPGACGTLGTARRAVRG